jgi:hypothetical protein
LEHPLDHEATGGKKGLKPDLAENKKTSLTDPIKKSKRIYLGNYSLWIQFLNK